MALMLDRCTKCPFPASFHVLTEQSMDSCGILRMSRPQAGNDPNFISGSGIGRMWKSIHIKRWSVEDKYKTDTIQLRTQLVTRIIWG